MDDKEWAQLMLTEQRRRLKGQIGAALVVSITLLLTFVALWCLIEMLVTGV